ncbi:cytochrome c biogenesis protein ResB [Biomphalaria pfeifferi]|uniref:Cytochrome c biogenesis protein ResB n=1 Tax=Biomphalaria pfeifferi TaxID=112525 RepID=A0AAD8AP47_BIOPF|nr:cytochrome c biogenesis protein ResB [Biomphalaria pfeifferi]
MESDGRIHSSRLSFDIVFRTFHCASDWFRCRCQFYARTSKQSDSDHSIQFRQKGKYNAQLPFTITCTDIQQKLINPGGEIDATNTLDWRTQIRIDDPAYGMTTADISLNNPFSYRGYRFFQAQTIPVGSARTMKFELTPAEGGETISLDLERNGTATLPNGTKVEYESFQPDFTLNGSNPDTKSAEYNNPAAVLKVTEPGKETIRVYAFANKLPDNAPINAPKAGYRWHLTEFEKAPFAHILSIKYDPYSAAFIAWYVGGTGLMLALVFVFFISHRRVWALIEEKPDNRYEVVLGGNTNRNHLVFEDKFSKIISSLSSKEKMDPNNKDKIMEEVSRIQKDVLLPKEKTTKNAQLSWSSYIPALFAIFGSFAMVGLRVQIGFRLYVRRSFNDDRACLLHSGGSVSTDQSLRAVGDGAKDRSWGATLGVSSIFRVGSCVG